MTKGTSSRNEIPSRLRSVESHRLQFCCLGTEKTEHSAQCNRGKTRFSFIFNAIFLKIVMNLKLG
jgi:hypothetical protein